VISRSTTLKNVTITKNVPSETHRSELYFQGYSDIIGKLPYQMIDAVTNAFWEAYRNDRTLFMFGNGGSAALSSHSACDFGKGTAANGNRRFRVMSLTDNVPLMTAWANDQRYDDIFAEQLRPFVRSGDVVFAISGSGNSANVLNGLQVARDSGAQTIGLTGFTGGKMRILCDLCIVIPSDSMQLIEDFHVAVTHSIFMTLRHKIFNEVKCPSE
jgi:D-sedoheptulose 7-phosphate isomerase